MRRCDFNEGWTFWREGSADGVSQADETATRAGIPVTLPHDALQTEERSADAPSGPGGAFYQARSYRYEKAFDVPAGWADRRVDLEFGGVYRHARVCVNGQEAASVSYGYLPFCVRIDELLKVGERNVVEVFCDAARQPDSRWYAGAGIFRPVDLWLGASGDDGIGPWDLRVRTLSASPARVRVSGAGAGARIEILEGERVVATGACGEADFCELEIPDARLWSAEDPFLYTCRATRPTSSRGRHAAPVEAETAEVRFGMRLLTWGPAGFFVNGQETLLRGGCIHHDNGILGAAAADEAERRRVRILKEAGFNAIRSSHNPASRALLDACDELGMYVMDEAWDMWYRHKSPHDYAGEWEDNHAGDLAALVAHDFNHPSVVMYSIGNEVSEPCEQRGVDAAREMVTLLHRLDASRPVTAGINLAILLGSCIGQDTYEEGGGRNTSADEGMDATGSLLFNLIASKVGTIMNNAANSSWADGLVSPVLDELDICGYNYASGRYPLEGRVHPERIVVGSETFPQEIARNWEAVERYPYLIGDFMWSAWDYLGEVGSGAWTWRQDERGFEKPYPWLLADTGAFDILGNPTGDLFWAQAVWGALDRPAISVMPPNHPGEEVARATWRGTNSLPSWAWQGCEGNLAQVEVYFRCKHVELWKNGQLVARRRCRRGRTRFLTTWEPGVLTAIALDEDDCEIARSELCSASAVEPHVRAEVAEAAPGELVFFDVWLGDDCVAESNADARLEARVEGGELVAFGSACPRTEERFASGSYTTYYGRALAAVRVGDGGSVRLEVSGEPGFATCELPVRS